jgi:hypothetical protein
MNKESGQSTIIAALSLSLVTIGFLAFAIDVGYMFHEKRMAQAAADAAALAAAEEVTYDGSGTIGADAQNAANAAATQNGFNTSAGTNPATVTLTSQGSGNYSNAGSTAAPSTWIQAQVSEPIPTFFLRGLLPGKTTLTVSATAVASGGQSSPTCVCLEGASGQDLNMSNNGKLDAVNCGVTADSSSSNAIGFVAGGRGFQLGQQRQYQQWRQHRRQRMHSEGDSGPDQRLQTAHACGANLQLRAMYQRSPG